MKKFITYSYFKLVSFYIKRGHKAEPEWLVMTLMSLLLAFNLLSLFFLIKLCLFYLFDQHLVLSKFFFGLPFLIAFIINYLTLFKKRDYIMSYWKNQPKRSYYKKYSVFIYILLSVFCFFFLMITSLKKTGGW